MGVASGCGSYYLSLLLLYLFFFAAASLLFVHFYNIYPADFTQQYGKCGAR